MQNSELDEDKEDKPKADNPGSEQFLFQDKATLTSIDDLYHTYSCGYFHSLESLKNEISKLIERVLSTRCKGELTCRYLKKIELASHTHLDRKKNDFNNKWKAFFESKFKENALINPRVTGEWMKKGGIRREYNQIDDYKIVTSFN